MLIGRSAVVRWLLLPALLVILLRAEAEVLAPSGASPLVQEILLSAAAVLLVGLVLDWVLMRSVRPLVRRLEAIALHSSEPRVAFLRRLAEERVVDTLTTADLLGADALSGEPPSTLAEWVQSFFALGGEPYRGVDTHGVAAFHDTYSWYLEIQGAALARRAYSSARDTRILISTPESLRNDYVEYPRRYLEFCAWHAEHDVDLRWIDPSMAHRLLDDHGLASADVGLWPNFAVLFFRDSQTERVRLGMRFPNDPDGPSPSYETVEAFVARLHASAAPLGGPVPTIESTGKTFAHAWADFLGVDERLRADAPLTRFLLSQLSGRSRVLDVGTGLGTESVLLLQHGHTVLTNQPDPRLADHARELARSKGVRLALAHALPEDLPETLGGNTRFDGVMALGNALSLVTEAPRRAACVAAFWKLLVPGGVLLIDERNYAPILDRREEILRAPLRAFAPARSGDVMFHGRSVRGYPTAIEEDHVVWDFFIPSDGDSPDGVPRHHVGNAPLSLYPLRHGELYAMLAEAGFVDVRVFADLREVAAGRMPSPAEVRDADFLTYVVRKPGGAS